MSLPRPQAFTPEFLLTWRLSTEYIFHLEHSAGTNGDKQPARLEMAGALGPPGNTGRRPPRDRGWTQKWASDLPTLMGSAKQQPDVGLLILEAGAREDLQTLGSILGGLSWNLRSRWHHFGQLLPCVTGERTFLEKSPRKDEVSIPSKILGDSRPGETTREGTVTPHYFISHAVQERGSSDLASSAFNAQAAVRRPHLGRREMTLTGMVHWCPFLRGGPCRRHTRPSLLQSTHTGVPCLPGAPSQLFRDRSSPIDQTFVFLVAESP